MIMHEAFDWQDEDTVIVKAQPATAVYFNNHREIVIRQVEDDEDVIIRLQPEHARRVAGVIRAIAAYLDGVECRETDAMAFELPETEDQPRDKTAAQRQRRRRERLKAECSPEAVTDHVTGAVTVDVTVAKRDRQEDANCDLLTA